MSLDEAALESGIESAAAQPASTSAGCAGQWADAVKAFAAGVVPPSTAVAAAASALESALAGAFASPAAAPGMEAAFTAFGATVAAGMAPAFTAVPPPAPVGFASLFAGPKPETHAQAASAVANLINTWAKTGTATPTAGGPPILWS